LNVGDEVKIEVVGRREEGEGEKESNLSAPPRSDRDSDRIGGLMFPRAESTLYPLLQGLDSYI
jgi:hypothetical protein